MSKRDEGEAEKDKLPSYTEQLAEFHRAFSSELKAIVGTVPLRRRAKVLDVGCGDGYYSGLFAGRGARVTALDANRAFLKLGRETYPRVTFLEGDIDDLSKLKGQFDLVWCAQSLFSLAETKKVMRAMTGALRPGGTLAILESDSLHQLLLAWPASFEMEIRAAELKQFHKQKNPQRFYIGRRLPAHLSEAGLKKIHFRTQAIDRRAPFDPALQNFLRGYFAKLLERTEKNLSVGALRLLHSFTNRRKKSYFLTDPQFTLTWINLLAWGQKPK